FLRESGGRSLVSRPPSMNARSVAGPLRSLLCLLHSLAHFRLDRIEIEARTALHRRIVEERLNFLSNHLLDEHEAPELELEPVEVLLATVFGAVPRPAGALE